MPLFRLKGHTEAVECVAVSNRNIVTGSADRYVKVWSAKVDENMANGNDTGISDQDENMNEDDEGGATANITSENYEPPNKKLNKNMEQTHHKPKPRNPLMTISGHSATVSDMFFNTNKNDTVLTSSLDQSLRIFDIELGRQTERIQSSKAILSMSHNSSSSFLATGSSDRHIRIYDQKNLEKSVINNLSWHQGWVSSVTFNPQNEFQLLSTSFDQDAVLWDIRSSKEPMHILKDAHDQKIHCSAWGLNGIFATGGADKKVATYFQ